MVAWVGRLASRDSRCEARKDEEGELLPAAPTGDAIASSICCTCTPDADASATGRPFRKFGLSLYDGAATAVADGSRLAGGKQRMSICRKNSKGGKMDRTQQNKVESLCRVNTYMYIRVQYYVVIAPSLAYLLPSRAGRGLDARLCCIPQRQQQFPWKAQPRSAGISPCGCPIGGVRDRE